MRTGSTLRTTPSSMTTPLPKPPFSPPEAAPKPPFSPPEAAPKPPFSPPEAAAIQRSPWRSPVPYLFGGLAAMLGLIAFALLILACSYWKLSKRMNTGEEQGSDGDVEAGEKNGGASVKRPLPVFEEKIVVIMAGDVKPTFLGTPMSRDSSFGDGNIGKSDHQNKEKKEGQKPRDEITDHFDQRITENTDEQMNREVQEITQPEPGHELNQ